jgi:hypothetical protein
MPPSVAGKISQTEQLMKRALPVVCLIIVGLFGFSALAACGRAVTDDVPGFSSPAEQRDWERKALAGDNGAAENLAARLGDEGKALPWLELAARRGDCHAMGLVSAHYIVQERNTAAASTWVALGKGRCEDYPSMLSFLRRAEYDQGHEQLVARARAGNCKDLEEVAKGYRAEGVKPEPWVRVVGRKFCSDPGR